MRYSPYEFKREDAFRFASEKGFGTYEKGDELFFKQCPFCRGSGKSNEKTFSINLRTGVFKCFRESCGRKGNMITLAREFDFSLGNEVDEYFAPKPNRKKFRKPKEPIIPKPAAIEYLAKRGISEETAKKYEITVRKDNDEILCFPFFNEKDELCFIKYRHIDPQKVGGNKEWCEKNGTPILFGMKQCNLENDTLIITEGQFDSLSVIEAGIENAVSVPTGAKGFTWVPFCWDWINQNFKTIIVFGDHEKGRITLLEDIKIRFDKICIKHVREDDYKDCKDANDILRKYGKDQIKKCIENAETIPVNNVIQLADVEYVNVYNLEKVKSGFAWLDKLLCGGIPFGGVVLISGKSGKGKSTLASQIMVNALKQNYICFAYSGELPNYMLKAWLDFQIAGPRHIIEQTGRFGETQYVISEANQKVIKNWYRDRFYLYDNRNVTDELVDLLEIIRLAIIRYGARVILLDNLMTALIEAGTKGENELDKQKNFVNSLRNIGMTYNVLILLVAHKRKNSFGADDGDDIAGSSNIYNLALINISYDSDKDIDENERKLKVTKNRIFGKIDPKGIQVHYDEKSKRIYGDGDNLNEETQCFVDSDGFIESINPETPFD